MAKCTKPLHIPANSTVQNHFTYPQTARCKTELTRWRQTPTDNEVCKRGQWRLNACQPTHLPVGSAPKSTGEIGVVPAPTPLVLVELAHDVLAARMVDAGGRCPCRAM
jgi:hypothetical protein